MQTITKIYIIYKTITNGHRNYKPTNCMRSRKTHVENKKKLNKYTFLINFFYT